MKIQMLFPMILVAFCASAQTASADFNDLKRRADEYRDSGQLAQDRVVRAAEAEAKLRREQLPVTNKGRMAGIREFAKNTGGLRGKPRVATNAEGEYQVIEFESGRFSCQTNGKNGVCIEKTTLEQWKCFYNFDFDLICVHVNAQ